MTAHYDDCKKPFYGLIVFFQQGTETATGKMNLSGPFCPHTINVRGLHMPWNALSDKILEDT